MRLIDQLAQDLSLRTPQKAALLRLDGVLRNISDLHVPLEEVAAAVTVREFERFDTEFPSFCFQIATAVGKTRLMGTCLAYLYHTKRWRNFFILTKGSTVYKKTIANFTKGNPKYVLQGYEDLPDAEVITGDNYERADVATRLQPDQMVGEYINLFIFNVEKLFDNEAEQRRFHSFNEVLGGSLAELLAAQSDLVLLMDESHRYRAEASKQSINALQPILGLEFTATPLVRNIIYRYDLGQAIRDSLAHLDDPSKPSGFIKVPVVLGRRDMHAGKEFEPFEEVQLKDGIARHRQKKAQLEAYCYNNSLPPMLPLVLISTKDIEHANAVRKRIEADDFFDGEYQGKTVVTHSRKGDLDEEDIEGLLQLESPTNTKEIVIHVNKLREGWDVKNVYTIIPLRAARSDVLTEQTIGRGLRLPFGVQTGNEDLDTLEIAAHDHFAEIVREAHKDSVKQGTPVPVKYKDVLDADTEEAVPYTVAPVADSPYHIEVPFVRARIESQAQLQDFPIAPGHSFSSVSPSLVGTVLGHSEQRTFDIPAFEMKDDAVVYLIRAVFHKCSSISSNSENDLKLVPTLIERYLTALSDNEDEWKQLVQAHAAEMIKDLAQQISANVTAQTSITWEQPGGSIEWRPWKVSVPKDFSPPLYDTIPPGDYKKGLLVDGYKHTIYPQASFDSKQEKWLADILEREAGSKLGKLRAWLRVPTRQLEIAYGSANYNPDLIADDGETIYLLEVKSANEVTDEVVRQKAASALAWCEAATKAAGGKRKWVYKLIPHDCIDSTDSFQGVLSKAANIARDQSQPVGVPSQQH